MAIAALLLSSVLATEIPAPARPGGVGLVVSGSLTVLAWTEPHRKGSPGAVRLAVSSDGGRSFGPAIVVSHEGARPAAMGSRGPGVAVAPDGAVLVAYDSRAGGGMEVWLARVSRAGAVEHWSVARPTAGEGYQMAPDVGVDPAGNVVVGWSASGESEEGSAYLALSTDLGRTYSRKVVLPGVCCPCCPVSLELGEDGTCYVAYRAVFAGGARDPALAVARRGLSEIEGPFRVSADGWAISGCPANGVSLRLLGGGAAGEVALAWYTGGRAPGIRFARGVAGRGLRVERVSLPASEAGKPRAPAIASADGTGVVLWAESGTGGASQVVWAQPALLSPPRREVASREARELSARGSRPGSCPAVARGGSGTLAAWVVERDGAFAVVVRDLLSD